jgi:hypothetical protein
MIVIPICVCIIGLCFALLLFANVMILAHDLGLFLSLILSTYIQVYYFSDLYCAAPLSRCSSFPIVSTTLIVNVVLFPST